MRVRDIVDVRRRPSVVRLEESADEELASYHLTPEVAAHVASLERAFAGATGLGVFVVGPYGSGKSHLLAWLARELEAGRLASPAPRVLRVSLLNYAGDVSLEEIVERAAGGVAASQDRRERWGPVLARNPHGLVILLDELSEFLRSKPDPARYSEDVRYLQFLGELCAQHRLFVTAALQEAIEHTGDIDRQSFRKIKDRFPLRLRLTPTHVRDLVADHLLVKTPDYAARTREIAQRLERALPGVELAWSELEAIYPIHPATLRFVEEVRDRFSEARGAIEFVLNRLGGDPTRGIAPLLDEPLGELLTPDVIVDHFRDVLELQPEFLPLAQQLFPYYESALAQLFAQDGLRALARRLVRLLVLDHLRAERRGISVAEATSHLLFAPSRLDPERNAAIVERTLERLVDAGRYVRREGARYHLDLAHEPGPRLERLVARELAELPDAATCFEMIAAARLARHFDPFELPPERWQARRLMWRFHQRAYCVSLGDEDLPAPQGEALCIAVRLPWGRREPAPSAVTLIPEELAFDEPLRELCALVRLLDRGLDAALRALVEPRRAELAELFERRLRDAYARGRSVGAASGAIQPAGPSASFDAWLEAQALHALRDRYPQFERLAPSDGPLPSEAYRSFLRFASARGIATPDMDPMLVRVREGYLVPMGLLRKVGRGYEVPARLDKNELVRLVLPLARNLTSIERVYERLAGPIHGLVPDQIHSLLLTLVALGEIDLEKEGTSIRTLYETVPLPLHYDRVVPGLALPESTRIFLDRVCAGLEISTGDGGVLAEQRAARDLREALGKRSADLEAVRRTLADDDALAARIDELKEWAQTLSSGADERAGVRALEARVGAAGRLLSRLQELEGLAARLERQRRELGRVTHLARQAGLDTVLEALGAAPGLEHGDALDAWLARAEALRREHAEAYAVSHRDYWERVAASAGPRALPAIARSTHVSLRARIEEHRRAEEALARAHCRGLSDLSYQSRCACGFDGARAPIEDALQARDSVVDAVERELRAFFAHDELRARVAAWADTFDPRGEAHTYVSGQASWPDVSEIDSLDRYLAGVEVVRELRPSELFQELEGTHQPDELARAVHQRLLSLGAARIRVRAGTENSDVPLELARWCVEQSLRTGVPLPRSVGTLDATLAADVDAAWVSARALATLDTLNLGAAIEERVLRLVMAAELAPEQPGACESVAAASEVRLALPADGVELAQRADRLYSAEPALRRAWPERLESAAEALASAPLSAAPITEVLSAHHEHQWLVLDALGLPLLAAVIEELSALLPDRSLDRVLLGTHGSQTSTDAFRGALARAQLRHEFTKVDAIDSTLHAHPHVAYRELRRLAVARLAAELEGRLGSLDAARPLLVTADHGFRLARGPQRRWEHGGPSTLERVVPVLLFTAAR